MNKNLLLISGAFIIILIVIWGYYFYTKSSKKAVPPQRQTPTQTQKSTQQTPTSTQAASFDNEKSVLSFIDLANPTDAQKIQFFEALEKFGKETGTVTISKCQATPTVLKIKAGSSFKVVNADATDYNLLFKETMNLSANQTVTVTADFGVGAHAYRCDGVGFEHQPGAGYFFVVE